MNKKKKGREAFRMLALISQLGICMLTAVFLCVFLGRFLVQKFQQELLFPLLLVIGIMAGMRSCYNMIKRFVDLQSRDPYHYINPSQNRETDKEGFRENEESDSDEMDKMDAGDQ